MRSSASFVVSAVLGMALLGGCGAGPPPSPVTPFPAGVPVGSSSHGLAVGGRTRTFRLYRPATLRPGPVPLLLMVHGGGGTARGAEEKYGWDAVADREGMVVAYPDGVGRSWNGGGGCCGVAGREGVDDVGFVTAMVAAIRTVLPIDPRRTAVTGISEGGILSYRLACDTRLFAVIAPDSATLMGPCPTPAPVSVLHIHGDADTRIPFDGRPGEGPNHITGGPVPAVVDRWRAIDGCGPTGVTTAGPVTTTTSACPGGRAVTLIVIAGAGHQWPGAPRGAGDPPSTALSATDEIQRFVAAHPG